MLAELGCDGRPDAGGALAERHLGTHAKISCGFLKALDTAVPCFFGMFFDPPGVPDKGVELPTEPAYFGGGMGDASSKDVGLSMCRPMGALPLALARAFAAARR